MYTRRAGILVAALLFAVSILSMFGRDKLYSENENRYLEAQPKLSAAAVFDGKYMENTEAYLSDHFFARDAMVNIRTQLDIFFGKKEVNNIYIGKNHFLFEKPSEYSADKVGKTLDTINKITKSQSAASSYFALAPNACEILSDLMPSNAPTQNQPEQIKKVYGKLGNMKCVDILSALQKAENKERLYYRTDHHWTYEAANIAFKQIAAQMKLNTKSVEYKSYCVTNSFKGTLASSASLFSAEDSIYITVPKNDVKYVVTYVDENKKTASVFDSSKLKKKDKYEVFFGGNFSQIEIETSAKSDKTLLLFKDSYANCLAPMLIPYFKKIVIIDPRYYTGNLAQTIKKENPTDMLWLYNVNTFLNDTSIVNSLG